MLFVSTIYWQSVFFTDCPFKGSCPMFCWCTPVSTTMATNALLVSLTLANLALQVSMTTAKLWIITGQHQQHRQSMTSPVLMTPVMHALQVSLVPVECIRIPNLFGFIRYRTFRYLTFQIMNFPIPNFSATKLFRHRTFQTPNFSDTKLFRYQTFQVPNFSDTKLFIFQTSQILAFPDT